MRHNSNREAVASGTVWCERCSRLDTFENVTLNCTFKHCGRSERIPEACYEVYIAFRELGGRRVIPTSIKENGPGKLLQWI